MFRAMQCEAKFAPKNQCVTAHTFLCFQPISSSGYLLCCKHLKLQFMLL